MVTGELLNIYHDDECCKRNDKEETEEEANTFGLMFLGGWSYN